MSITLGDLVGRLQNDAPVRDGIPNIEQYDRCIKAAVADLGSRAGRYKIATLSIVSGTASYDLPDDFVRLIRLESLIYPDNIMHTAAGIVPLETGFQERTTVANGQITFYPTPSYSSSRYLHYQAGWALDIAGEYDELEDWQAEALLKEAACLALMLQANYYAQQAWQYQIGDERVSKEKLASELRAQAQANHDQYVQRVGQANGPYGTRSDYDVSAYAER